MRRIIGTAIWVYCILVEIASTEYASYFGSNISFELDGTLEGTFIHVLDNPWSAVIPLRQDLGDQNGGYSYNQTVFSKTGLQNQDHTLVITPVRGANASLLLFDWAEYT